MDVPDYFYRYVDILQEYNEQFGCNLSNIVELAQSMFLTGKQVPKSAFFLTFLFVNGKNF